MADVCIRSSAKPAMDTSLCRSHVTNVQTRYSGYLQAVKGCCEQSQSPAGAMKIISVRVCPLEIDKEDDLEDILATDDLFVEYFNEYLSLPVFAEPLWFNRDLGSFEVVDGAKKHVAKRLKAAVRASRGVPKIYRPALRHSFCTISLIPLESDGGAPNAEEIDTSFSVTMLNKEQGMKWVKANRFHTFLRSDLYVEYRLAKIVSQVDCTDISNTEPLKISLDFTPLAKKVKPEELLPPEDVDDTEDILRSMCVCMGATATTDVDSWVSLARSQLTAAATTVTSVTHAPVMSISASSHERAPEGDSVDVDRSSQPSVAYGGVESKLFFQGGVSEKSATPRPEDVVCQVLPGAGGGVLDRLPAHSSKVYVTPRKAKANGGRVEKPLAFNHPSGGDDSKENVPVGGGAANLVFATADALSGVVAGTALKHALAAVVGMGRQPSDYSEQPAVKSLIAERRHRQYTLDELEEASCYYTRDDAVTADLHRSAVSLALSRHDGDGDDSTEVAALGEDSDDSGYAAGAQPLPAAAAAAYASARPAAEGPRSGSLATPQEGGLRATSRSPDKRADDDGGKSVDGASWTARQLQTAMRQLGREPPIEAVKSSGSANGNSAGGEDDSALESESDYEEVDKPIFKRRHTTKKFKLTTKKGIEQFKEFLRGTVGERNWELWLDIDRARLSLGTEELSLIEYLKEKYYNQGAAYELSASAKEDLGLVESFRWTLSNLFRLQNTVVEPLLTYWAPRYVLRRSLPLEPPELINQEYRVYKLMSCTSSTITSLSALPSPCQESAAVQGLRLTPVGPAADVATPVMLPLRPKSCAPRLHTLLAEQKKLEGPTPKDFGYAPPAQESLPELTPPLGQRRAQSAAAVQLVRAKAKLLNKWPEAVIEMTHKNSASVSASRARAQSARPATSSASQSRDGGERLNAQLRRRPATVSPRPPSAPGREDGHRLGSSGSDRRPASRLRQSSERTQSAASGVSTSVDGRRSPTSAFRQTPGESSQDDDGVSGQSELKDEVESTASSDVSAELFGGRRLEHLLKTLSNEGNSGKFFRKSVETSKNKRTLACLLFWEDVQEYRHMFYGAKFSTYAAQQKALEIFARYVTYTGKNCIGCSEAVCRSTSERLQPPYEDLFDAAEEYALGILYEAWQLTTSADIAALSEVDTKTFTRALETKTKYIINLKRRGLLKSADNLLEDPMEGYKDPVYDPTLIEKIPEDFRDFTFEKLVKTPIYLETYRQFLQTNFASTDLNFWSDIEAFRRLPPDAKDAADTKAREIKTKYLNKRYFFGPNSPATRDGLNQMMQSVGGWGNIFPDRPADQLIVQAQTFVQERLEKKWLPLFLASRQFEELHRPDQHMADAAEAILLQKRRKNQAIYKMLESRWISSSNEIMAFRKALLNPVLSYQFQRYVSVKSDSLENDVLFWKEVQKYKKMHHSHTSDAFIQQKINVIINCFIDSPLPPAIQIDIPPEQAERILDKRREMGPYLFREAQLAVFRVLFEYWGNFCEFRANVSTDEVVSTLERHRRRAKLRERKRAQKLEEQKEKEIARRRALGLPLDDEADEDAEGRTHVDSHAYHDHPKEVEGGSGSDDVPKISWSYSHYLHTFDREDLLSRTDEDTFSSLMDEDVFTELNRMRQVQQPAASTINVSDLRDVKATSGKENTATTTLASSAAEPVRTSINPSKLLKSESSRPIGSASLSSGDKQRHSAAETGKQASISVAPSAVGTHEISAAQLPLSQHLKNNGAGGGVRSEDPATDAMPGKISSKLLGSASVPAKKAGVTFADTPAKPSAISQESAEIVNLGRGRATLQTTSLGAMVPTSKK